MKESSRVRARQHFIKSFLEEASDGKAFTVEFVKKNGEVRVMNARLGVKKGLTGRGMKYNPVKRGLLPVYDMQKQARRMINFDTIMSYTIHGRRVEDIAFNDTAVELEEL